MSLESVNLTGIIEATILQGSTTDTGKSIDTCNEQQSKLHVGSDLG